MSDPRIESLADLRVPLYKLYYLDDLDDFEFCHDEAMRAVAHYGLDRILHMIDALTWAEETPDLEWETVLPNLTHGDTAIRHYIETTRRALESAMRLLNETPTDDQ